MPSFESLLLLGVIGFYLYDSIMLLSINELLLTKSYKGWFYKFPELGFQLLRRYPLLPNPLIPHVAIFRTSWPNDTKSFNESQFSQFSQSLEPIQLVVNILLLLLLGYLPTVSLIYGSGSQLLILFLIIYLLIITILIYVFNNKKALLLSNSDFTSLAIESFLCQPFALNMVRKISLNYPNIGDPVSFSKSVFDKDSKKAFGKDIGKVISRRMMFLEVGSKRYLKLNIYLEDLHSKEGK